MKIFITGASGMLGTDVVSKLKKEKLEVFATDLKPANKETSLLDVRELAEIEKAVKKTKPDYIFHLAAETNVDLCEEKPDHAFKTNTLGTENVALVCQKLNIPLLYISTAGVFWGDKNEPYNEFDLPRPANIYGHSKLQGEYAVMRLLSRYFILRAGWMVGGWAIDKKFVYKMVQQIKEGRKELKVVNDKIGSPTFTKDFANNLMSVINSGRYGLYHMTNKSTGSRYDIALKVVEFMGVKDKVKVKPISSSQFPLPAPRADSEMMSNYKLELLGLNNMPNWQESLKEYIASNKDK
ncbi:MAG: dTDP-4-dehydrorhamnose reductase [Candidatus Omnitrophica bacterium]|nr:dTDP-4-dehydrorhamnose reductase [Candidatus Omnitrophota bacterium]